MPCLKPLRQPFLTSSQLLVVGWQALVVLGLWRKSPVLLVLVHSAFHPPSRVCTNSSVQLETFFTISSHCLLSAFAGIQLASTFKLN